MSIILSVVFLAIISLISVLNYNSTHRELVAAQEAEVQYQTKEQAKQANVGMKNVLGDATGLDTERLVKDDMAAEVMIRSIVDWKNYDAYMSNREKAMKDYNIPADSNFAKYFMPPLEKLKDADGNDYYNYRDGGKELNMSFASKSSNVINIDGDVYTYLTEVSVTIDSSYEDSHGTEHDISGVGSCVFRYDVDGTGKVTNVDAYTVANQMF